jgi:perosamine synthetase
MKFPNIPQRFNIDEIEGLVSVLKNNKLWPYPVDDKEGYVNIATELLKKYFDVPYVVTTSSGTASIHTALAGLKIKAGSEIILPPITDAGTVTPIIIQNAIPIFADVDPITSNITAEHIEPLIGSNTSAVIVVHLAGCPVDMNPIVKLCKERGLFLIEDAAQALGATYNGKLLGTIGDVGCFSLNDQKHITCGEGGFITCKSEEVFYEAHNFHDKYYDRHNRGVRYHGIGLNYRISELEGALIISQLPKLIDIVSRRRMLGDMLSSLLAEVDGVIPQRVPPNSGHSYFFFMFRIDDNIIKKSREEIIAYLVANGIKARGGYVEQPLYTTKVFREKSFFHGGVWPAELVAKKQIDYNIKLPNAEAANSTTISFSFHQGLSEVEIREMFELIKKAVHI